MEQAVSSMGCIGPIPEEDLDASLVSGRKSFKLVLATPYGAYSLT